MHWVCTKLGVTQELKENIKNFINLLLELGTHIDSLDSGGQTPLMWAAANGAYTAKGANFELKDNAGATALALAKYNENNKDVYELLKKQDFIQLNQDDSSDEEDVQEKLKKYDIDNAWQGLLKDKGKLGKIEVTEQNLKISFLMHAAGLNILYSKQVNNQYYIYKNIYLKSGTSISRGVYNLTLKTIRSTIIEWIEKVKVYIFSGHQENFKEILSKFEPDLHEHINNTVSSLYHDYSLFRKKWPVSDHVKEVVSKFSEKMAEYLLNFIRSKEFGYREPVPIIKAKVENDEKLLKAAVLNALKVLNNKGLIRLNGDSEDVNNYFLFNKKNSRVKQKVDVSDTIYKNVTLFVWEKIKARNQRAVIYNSFSGKARNSVSPSLVIEEFLKDLCKIDEASPDSIDSEVWSYIKGFPFLLEFFPIGHARFRQIALTRFQEIFYSKVENNSYVCRKTLPPSFNVYCSSRVSFFANVRLSNRSQKRVIRNLHDSALASALSLADIKQGKEYIRAASRTWFFNAENMAIESQSILKSGGREDYIENAGSYGDLYTKIDKLKAHFNKNKASKIKINDSVLASWIRGVFLDQLKEIDDDACELNETDKEILKTFLSAATYLILGCEVARNPSALITNQMMLDLIIAGRMSWEEALQKEKMPMAPAGAVAVARKLHGYFSDYMPYRYSYPGTKDGATKETIKQLIMRETAIAEKWFGYKESEVSLNDIKIKPSELLQKFEEHYKRWFGSQWPEAIDQNTNSLLPSSGKK